MDGDNGTVRVHKWTLRKELSVGDIVVIGTAVVGIIVAYGVLDKRLSIVEISQDKQVLVDRAQDAERIVVKNELHERLTNIDNKLDWLIRSDVESERRSRR